MKESYNHPIIHRSRTLGETEEHCKLLLRKNKKIRTHLVKYGGDYLFAAFVLSSVMAIYCILGTLLYM